MAPRWHKEGMTLVEVMVSILIISAMATAIVLSVRVARQLTYATAQRVAAFGMGKAMVETIRAMDYNAIAPTNFVTEANLRFTHLSGRERTALTCTRTVSITPLANPERKEIGVSIRWQYRDQALQEQVSAIIYPG